jgi:hypothetical protein
MKMTAFWDVVPCSLVEITDISETLSASIIRASDLLKQAGDGIMPTGCVHLATRSQSVFCNYTDIHNSDNKKRKLFDNIQFPVTALED